MMCVLESAWPQLFNDGVYFYITCRAIVLACFEAHFWQPVFCENWGYATFTQLRVAAWIVGFWGFGFFSVVGGCLATLLMCLNYLYLEKWRRNINFSEGLLLWKIFLYKLANLILTQLRVFTRIARFQVFLIFRVVKRCLVILLVCLRYLYLEKRRINTTLSERLLLQQTFSLWLLGINLWGFSEFEQIFSTAHNFYKSLPNVNSDMCFELSITTVFQTRRLI